MRAAPGPERILVAEDDPATARLLEAAFRGDARVRVHERGEEALRELLDGEADFLITDLGLPGIPGDELIRRARRSHVAACVPILVLTARHDEATLLRCYEAGADDFMVKPFAVSELRARVFSIHLRQQLARDVNPLSRLPGNGSLKREIDQRLREGRAFDAVYLDLDHFKPFNDAQGLDAGDEAILLLAELLLEAARAQGPDAFVGHAGGDDFLVVAPSGAGATLGARVQERFTVAVERFYDDADRARGATEVVDRRGRRRKVPLLSISIAVVPVDPTHLKDVREITHRAAALKKAAKEVEGPSLLVERRR